MQGKKQLDKRQQVWSSEEVHLLSFIVTESGGLAHLLVEPNGP